MLDYLCSVDQVRVQVADGGSPPLTAEAIVNVTVNHNQNTPVISGTTVSIPYNTYKGRLITTLNATDADSPNVSLHMLFFRLLALVCLVHAHLSFFLN